MDEVIALILDTCVLLCYWIAFASDLPSLLEKLCSAIVVELMKMCYLLEFPIGGNLKGYGSVELRVNSIVDEGQVVSSYDVLKVCQAPYLKMRLTLETMDVILSPLKQSKGDIFPIVHSEVVYSFCQALDLRAKLAPTENRLVFNPQKRSKKDKITPVVHSK
ncbi:hypothetical protein NPIL_458711 [Nephila pilipes]|uniref:Uncharacterized protein n=1 Tax=Nephila pilipes TaxID=299642 RepID=A0A8X6QMN6_NEPPI|nr:hypothetical protein NPIL_458711 [Nephila pilipes]